MYVCVSYASEFLVDVTLKCRGITFVGLGIQNATRVRLGPSDRELENGAGWRWRRTEHARPSAMVMVDDSVGFSTIEVGDKHSRIWRCWNSI